MDNLIALIAALGIGSIVGGIIGAWSHYFFERKREVDKEEHALKQKRYLCILILMMAQLQSKAGVEKIKQYRPDLDSIIDIKREIQTELLNAIVFASDPVLLAIAMFIDSPNYDSFGWVASEMRKDLWGRKSTIASTIITALTPVKPA